MFYLTDRQGSVVDIISSDGQINRRLLYDGLGKQSLTWIDPTLASSGFWDTYGYTGRELDPYLRLQYNRARFYDPEVGRWISPDPLGYAAGDANLYRYVSGNPVNFTDPSGYYAIIDDAIAMGVGALVGVIGQGIGDLINGEFSGWEAYVGSAVAGAVYGEVLIYAGPWAAGAASGAAGNATTQGLRILSCKQESFDWASFGVATVAGFVGGGIGGSLFSKLAGSGGAGALRTGFAGVTAGLAGGGAGGAVGGFYNGALDAANRGDNIFQGGLEGSWRGARDGAIQGAATAGVVFGGIKTFQSFPRLNPLNYGINRAWVSALAEGDITFSGGNPLSALKYYGQNSSNSFGGWINSLRSPRNGSNRITHQLGDGEVPLNTPFDPDSHNLVASLFRNRELVSRRQFVSGEISANEYTLAKQQGLKPEWRIGDTENRALRAIDLLPGDRLVLEGQWSPCPQCQITMYQRSIQTGAEIQYRYLDKVGKLRVWSAQQGGYIYAEL